MSELFTTTPPTEPGWYWVRQENREPATVQLIDPSRTCPRWLFDYNRWDYTHRLVEQGYKFGPRIPSPELCVELDRKPTYTLADVHGVDFSNERRSWIDANGRARPIEQIEASARELISGMMERMLDGKPVVTEEQAKEFHAMIEEARPSMVMLPSGFTVCVRGEFPQIELSENEPESEAKNVAVSPR